MLDIATGAEAFNPAIFDPETGEVLHEEQDGLGYQLSLIAKGNQPERRRTIRSYRSKVQRMARETLKPTKTPKGNRWRVCDCMRLPVPLKDVVLVAQSPTTKTAALRNLVTCGQVWTCPVCASKIAGVRRDEVRQGLSRHLAGGLVAVSVTLTVRHGVGHSAKRLLVAMSGSLNRMRANRRIKRLREQYSYRGQIRALEVTYGAANGWHPHFHEVWFLDTKLWSPDDEKIMHREIAAAWIAAVETTGLPAPSAEVGVMVKRIDTPRDYEGKGNASIDGIETWDAADEMTRAIAKTAKRGRMSPFDLLVAGEFGLFEEYARAFHGKRQLTWSPGLKAHFAIGERTDEEVSADDESEGVPVMAIDHREWMRAFKVMPEIGCRVLDVVERQGAVAAVEWLRSLGYASRVVDPPGIG